ncbi:MAG: superoxide dismutase family protein [Alphaproteobacteria bacterium]|nr:superoxide dismutase family protein [Alphaproteobacteria bacterium]MBV9372757.1 superoxide dismutase family protein [Alphaproteobacteria bacterium]MBV9900768.1 superoxide dismutase family protein [Alphaproteobacteria bacterium]
MGPVALAALLAACTATTAPEARPDGTGQAPGASAEIKEPSGRTVARARIDQAGDGLRVRIDAAGLAPGAYGAHLHAVGRCDPPAFASAGPHWNPSGRQHGKDNPQGMHLGDLPNLMVGTDRRGSLEYTVPAASLTGGGSALLDADGAAIVLHAQADDYRTDPSGNSGARIACGVLG